METNSKSGPNPAAANGESEITLADVASYDWEGVLSKAERPVCSLYATQLFQKSSQLAESGDEKGERVFRFLGSVAFMALRPNENESPFAPSIVMENRRSAVLEDFSAGQLDVLAGVLPNTRDAAMRARFGDMLWVARKDHKAAKLAAEAYLENFKRLKLPQDWAWKHGIIAQGLQSCTTPWPKERAVSKLCRIC